MPLEIASDLVVPDSLAGVDLLAIRSARFVKRGLAAETGRQLLGLLMERKRKLFPKNDRMLMKVEAIEGENGLDVIVIWGRYAKAQ